MNDQPDGDWRAAILRHFSPASAAASRLTIVSDPDALLTEPGVVQRLGERGFALFSFEDPVAFRFAYEGRFRRYWDRGEPTHLVVVLRAGHGDLNQIPHDLLEEARIGGRILSFSLPELFPMLAPAVVADLDPIHFDRLAQAIEQAKPDPLGTHATRDFVLRHVFGIAPELIKTPADLLRMLLQRHYRPRAFPAGLDHHLVEQLKVLGGWDQWALDRIVPGPEEFLVFLGERWSHFLLTRGGDAVHDQPLPTPTIPGPLELPFDHDDVRVYVERLFTEELLPPSTAIQPHSVEGTWYRVGVAGDRAEDGRVRLERLLDALTADLPDSDADHLTWSQFAWRWAEALSLRWRIDGDAGAELAARMDSLHADIEARFADWMQARYAALHSLPHLPWPTTLDKVVRYLAYQRNQSAKGKLALLIVDGMALDQWILVRESLRDLVSQESQVFAWVPTLTTVSRQSIFAGEPPYFYAQSIGTTQKEPQHWARVWADQGLRGPAVGYLCQKKDEPDAAFAGRVQDAAEQPPCKVLGVVVGTVDQMMHGTVTGTGGLHAAVRHWAQQGHLRDLARRLLSLGFEIFLTADHGNIEGVGMGKPNVGAIAGERGERVHVFPHPLTRNNVHQHYPETVPWPATSLPDEYLPLLATGRNAFIPEGKRIVGHGGISLEEVIVPFVQLKEPQ
ncbi:MAG: BREX-3 system phosphatase PglZ [Lamprobacter sp.]|uniref:BREX-3 system phosphatase PglZ n=1 Tax=Lamprobacter sp. TaxID=3100796 RepID=UPI002B260049|nr:BREX-3 system phosphatase PglZ [Lamprobacter sp.]MEA3641740.1 BREX-3 system phosphatase PglZ [Lamprobacter sp.]